MEGEKKEYNHDNDLPLSTCHQQISALPPEQAPVCINQPQASDHQPQQTTYGVQKPNTSWNTTWNTPHPVIVTTAPVRRKVVDTVPPTYLSLALCSCVFCFWPLGACAVIYSLKTSTLLDDGDIEGAQSASKKALILSLSSIGTMMSIFITFVLALLA